MNTPRNVTRIVARTSPSARRPSLASAASPPSPSLDMKSIAAHVVVSLAHAQELGRTVRLDELAADIGVRKSDVRDVVTQLHAEGHVDALRLRLTMTGLVLATSLADCKLREPRRHEVRLVRVA